MVTDGSLPGGNLEMYIVEEKRIVYGDDYSNNILPVYCTPL